MYTVRWRKFSLTDNNVNAGWTYASFKVSRFEALQCMESFRGIKLGVVFQVVPCP